MSVVVALWRGVWCVRCGVVVAVARWVWGVLCWHKVCCGVCGCVCGLRATAMGGGCGVCACVGRLLRAVAMRDVWRAGCGAW